MIDILAIAAHPDDIELACSGTLLYHQAQGKTIGIVDLTRGELGTRGTAETRDEEASNSAKILNLNARENLNLGDGFFEETKTNLTAIANVIRKYKPSIVFANAVFDRHPDHARAAKMVDRAAFLAGLPKLVTNYPAHRPSLVLHYIQDRWVEPQFIIDITPFYDKKLQAIQAFKTQFYDPNSTENETPISSPQFLQFLEARAREFGRYIGVAYGEGFTSSKAVGVNSFFSFL